MVVVRGSSSTAKFLPSMIAFPGIDIVLDPVADVQQVLECQIMLHDGLWLLLLLGRHAGVVGVVIL